MHRLGAMVLSGEWAEMRGQGRAALHLLEFAGRGGCADALALAGHAIAAAAAGGRIAGIETPVYLEKDDDIAAATANAGADTGAGAGAGGGHSGDGVGRRRQQVARSRKEEAHAWQFYHTAAMYGSIDAHAALGRRYLIGATERKRLLSFAMPFSTKTRILSCQNTGRVETERRFCFCRRRDDTLCTPRALEARGGDPGGRRDGTLLPGGEDRCGSD
jgi:hypothetical protein